ncbi:MAG: class I SAM-dependent methyltransferase [Verrucomicrobiota bacterium]
MAETWQDIETLIKEIPEETCGGNQPEFVYQLSRDTTGKGEVVEIGTNVGKTTIAMSFAQKEKQGNPIYTVDIYQHRDIEGNLERAGVSDYVHRIISSSSSAGWTWDKPVELLWIDGDHCHIGAAVDIKAWMKHVVPGGRIALHDYPGHRQSLQVWRAVRAHLFGDPYRWRLVSDREAGSIIVFERLEGERPPFRWNETIYWLGRNLRALIFTGMPGLSKKLVDRVKNG